MIKCTKYSLTTEGLESLLNTFICSKIYWFFARYLDFWNIVYRLHTWIADIPTNEFKMLSNNVGSRLVIIFTISMPNGRRILSHFSIALAKIGIRNSCAPIPNHCDPIPENTNHTGGFSFVID